MKKKNMKLVALFVCVLLLGIGYATMTNSITANGEFKVSSISGSTDDFLDLSWINMNIKTNTKTYYLNDPAESSMTIEYVDSSKQSSEFDRDKETHTTYSYETSDTIKLSYTFNAGETSASALVAFTNVSSDLKAKDFTLTHKELVDGVETYKAISSDGTITADPGENKSRCDSVLTVTGSFTDEFVQQSDPYIGITGYVKNGTSNSLLNIIDISTINNNRGSNENPFASDAAKKFFGGVQFYADVDHLVTEDLTCTYTIKLNGTAVENFD